MEIGVDYTIRELSPVDKLNSFKTGHEAFAPLKAFLRNQSLSFQSAQIAKTYVAVKLDQIDGQLIENNDLGVMAYLTLTCSEIDIRNGYSLEDCPYANDYESLPALKIARLAVDSRYRGKHIGEELVSLAIAIASDVIAPVVGCRFVITDSKSGAVGFYERAGFTLLDTDANRASETPVMFVDLLNLDGY